MKAEINEVSGAFKLPGCFPKEAVEETDSSSVVVDNHELIRTATTLS